MTPLHTRLCDALGFDPEQAGDAPQVDAVEVAVREWLDDAFARILRPARSVYDLPDREREPLAPGESVTR